MFAESGKIDLLPGRLGRRPVGALLCAARAWHFVVTSMLVTVAGLAACPAHGVTITGLNGTGLNYSNSTATPDANWNVVALPQFFSGPQSPPYAAWIFTGGAAPANIPNVWLGGSSNSGTNGYHWIGVRENDATSLTLTGTVGQYYSMIYSTTFQASATGTATLSLDIAVDNRATVFVGGTPTTGSDQLTITGGQQLGSVIWNKDWWTDPDGNTFPRAFEILQNASGSVNVVAGSNTLYVVVDDIITTGTTFGFTGLLVAPVPEPSTFLLAVVGMALGGWRMLRRGRRNCHVTRDRFDFCEYPLASRPSAD